MEYFVVYDIFQVLFFLTLPMTERKAVFLVGKHIHHIYLIPIDKGLAPYCMAEILITKLLKKQEILYVLRVLDIIFIDDIGQVPDEILFVLDIIF